MIFFMVCVFENSPTHKNLLITLKSILRAPLQSFAAIHRAVKKLCPNTHLAAKVEQGTLSFLVSTVVL
jgi:hypothetical protein